MLKIKADKELWDAWHGLKDNLSFLAGIVQNDQKISGDFFKEWLSKYVAFKQELKEVYINTLKHVENSK